MRILKVVLILSLILGHKPIFASDVAKAGGMAAAGYLAYKAATSNAVVNSAAYKTFKKGCPWTCALAIAAGAMILVSLTTAKKARGVTDDLSCAKTNSCFSDGNGNPYNPNNPNGPRLDPNSPGDRTLVELERQRPQIERFLQEREKEGYKIDRKSGAVTDPKGNPIRSMSDAMNAGGMSPQQRAEAEATLAEAAKEGESLLKKMEEYDEEFGGGGGGSGTAGGYNPSGVNPNGYRVPGSANPNGSQPSVAGLSVNHGSDSIGVAGDNLFEMVHRRYEANKPNMNPNAPVGP